MTHPVLPRIALAGALALSGLLGAGGAVLAQDATPEGETALPTREAPARPVHIHAGTCEELGEIVYPLNPIELPQGEAIGDFDEAVVTGISYTPLEAPFPELIGGQYAVNVHFSEDQIGNYIACGEVGGVLTEQGALPIVLQEVNDSGFAGVAFLSPSAPAPDAASDVSIFLIPLDMPVDEMEMVPEEGADIPDAMTEATPAMDGEEPATTLDETPATDIGTPAVTAPEDGADVSFATFDLGNPSRVSVAAGEELTIVNTAEQPRGLFVPALNLAVLVAPGETLEVPLETPGEFPSVILDEAGTAIATGPLIVE